MVERDLAKVEAAGSSPVSRSGKNEDSVERLVLLFLTPKGSEPRIICGVRGSSLRFGPCRTEGLRSTSVGAEQTSPGRLAPPGPRAPRLALLTTGVIFVTYINAY